MESTITQSKAQLKAKEQRDLIAELTRRAEAAETALAAMPAPITDEEKLGWCRIHMDWAGSTSMPTPRDDVAVLLVPNLSFNDNTRPLSGLLADFTKLINTTPLTLGQAREEIISGLIMGVDKAKSLATGEADPDDLATHAPDFRKNRGNGGFAPTTGTVPMAS